MDKINPDRLLKELRRGKFNRRTFMQGMAATGVAATMIPATQAKAASTITVIPDPVGTFYRYGLAKSLLRRKVDLPMEAPASKS